MTVSAVTCSRAERNSTVDVGDRSAIDGFAQDQERAHRKLFGESPAVMIEILGDGRPLEAGHQAAEPGVQLDAAAIREHAQLTGAAHAGGDVAVAPAVAHQLALQMAGRGAPAVGSQARPRC